MFNGHTTHILVPKLLMRFWSPAEGQGSRPGKQKADKGKVSGARGLELREVKSRPKTQS